MPKQNRIVLAIAATLFIIIVVLETVAPANIVGAYAFVLPILLVATLRSRPLMLATVIACIAATYLGREFEARTVSSPAVEIAYAGALQSADAASAISAAMEKANLVLIARVRQTLWGHESPRALSSQRFELAMN